MTAVLATPFLSREFFLVESKTGAVAMVLWL